MSQTLYTYIKCFIFEYFFTLQIISVFTKENFCLMLLSNTSTHKNITFVQVFTIFSVPYGVATKWVKGKGVEKCKGRVKGGEKNETDKIRGMFLTRVVIDEVTYILVMEQTNNQNLSFITVS